MEAHRLRPAVCLRTTDANSDLIEATKALYFGRVVSFYKRTLDLDYLASEEQIVRQAKYFFRMRGYLRRKYRGAEKLSA